MTKTYEFPKGFHIARLYPVESESAVAELWFGEAPWAQIGLRGVQHDEVGDARVGGVQFIISLYPPPPDADRAWWEFDLQAVREQFDAAQDWLLENEKQRLPSEVEGLTRAGQAFDKIAPGTAPWYEQTGERSDPDQSDPR